MKAKFLTIIALAAASMVTSCNMDLPPIGSLDEQTAIQSVNDVRSFRNFFYSAVRSFCSSDFLVYSDIQADCFNGLTINGNRMGTIANGTVLASDGDITGYWSSLYYYINNINYFLVQVEPVYQKAVEENNEDAIIELDRYIGEAHFFRGYFYAMMFDRWCVLYSPENGDKPGMGLPIVTEYNPTPDRTAYKGRSTMNETIKFIQDELEIGRQAMMKYEEVDKSSLKPMAVYLSSKAVEAMQARVALWIGDYNTAVAKAESVINSNIYTLANTKTYTAMWTDDISNEIIYLAFEDDQELSGSIGDAWIGSQSNQADYVPSSDFITHLQIDFNALMGSGDIRYTTYIGVRKLSTDYGPIGTPCFIKFPGNPALMDGTTPNIMNCPKVFRLSELYLILAEASYYNGDYDKANKTLKTFKLNRYSGRKGETPSFDDLTGEALLSEIKFQRTLELAGEGFRLSDLRRWKQGFTRTADYDGIKYSGLSGVNKSDINTIITPAGLQVTYSATDYRYTWPIPSTEIDVNPQIKGQQNPGY